jgi:methylglyoxal/glyoxal reductase
MASALRVARKATTTTVYLLRHGDRHDFRVPAWKEKIAKAGGLVIDPPLSALGHRQARETAELLKNEPIDMILCSPYVRTIQTATPLAEALGVPISVEPGLSECHHVQDVLPGPNKRFETFPNVDFEYAPLLDPQTNTSPKGKETTSGYFNRMMNFSTLLSEQLEGKTVVLFSHAASVALVAALLDCDMGAIPKGNVGGTGRSDLFAPCGVYKLVRHGGLSGKWELERNGSGNEHLSERSPETYPWGFQPEDCERWSTMRNMRSTLAPFNNGLTVPRIGYGTYQRKSNVQPGDVKNMVLTAIRLGYRHIDCATFYNNEAEVGDAIRECGLKREELFITGKVWNDFQGYDACRVSFMKSMNDLGIDYFDLFLVHWPFPGLHTETYRCLEQLHAEGKLRSIGVSNYTVDDYKELKKTMKIKPVCNQIEVNPMLYRKETIDFFHSNGVRICAYKPLGAGKTLKNQVVLDLASKYNVSAGQLCIRWGFQHGFVVITKSGNEGRMKDNYGIFNFQISNEDMGALDAITTAETKENFYEHYLSRRSQDPPSKRQRVE